MWVHVPGGAEPIWDGGDDTSLRLRVNQNRNGLRAKHFSGSHLNNLRKRHLKLRQRLQKKGTQSAKRLLRKRRQIESRFARDVNHRIAKKLVRRAQDTGRGIALEDLKGIRERVTVKKSQRRQHHSWAFHQLNLSSTKRSWREYRWFT
jgi:putative transposase